MRVTKGFLALFTFLSLALMACGSDFTAAWTDKDAGSTHDVITDKPKKETGSDVDHEDAVQEDAGKDQDIPDTQPDVLQKDQASEDVVPDQEIPDQKAEDAAAEDVATDPDIPDQQSEDAVQEDANPDQEMPDQQAEDSAPDVEPDVVPEAEPPPDVKPDGPLNICEQNMTTPNDYFVIGQSPIGGSVRISLFGSVDFPPDAGVDTPMSGWCWGNLGQTKVVCPIPVNGIVPGTFIFLHPGVSVGYGDPQSAPLCETGICNQAYHFCHGPTVICAVNGGNTTPGTQVPDQTIKCPVP